MVIRARLAPPSPAPSGSPWHEVKCASLPLALLARGGRRLEAESYLSSGFGIKTAIESHAQGWGRIQDVAHVTQPPRLKATIVSREHGTPYLSATQVFDLRPRSHRYVAVQKILDAGSLSASDGDILVTRSGSVGRAIMAYAAHSGHIISDDLLRVHARSELDSGWVYAFLRSSSAREMMRSAHYGHVIKHLEVSHLNEIPIPIVPNDLRNHFRSMAASITAARNASLKAIERAESLSPKP